MIIHTVQPGESVYSIAKMYNTTPTKILEDNDLTTPDRLVVGQTLVLLFPTRTYTVRQGDTLSSISAKFGIPLRTLFQNNPVLGGEDALYPGQILTLDYPAPAYGALSVNGYAYPGINIGTLRRTLPYLTYLTVFSARVLPEGRLLMPDDDILIAEARKYGVAPILLLTNLSERGGFSSAAARDILSNPATRVRMVDDLRRQLRERNYAGVEFDFEYVPAELAESYANLVDNTRQILCEDERCVFAAVAPKYSDNQSGILYEGHPYASLGEAVNGIRLMTYEWGYTYGPPMPVAPLPQVRRVAEYAKTRIPDSKLTLGIPSYGYDWTLPYEAGVSRARSLGSVEAVNRASEVHARIEYDNEAESPYYRYYDTSVSPAAEHIVYFEDGRSIKAKLDLIHELGLSGAGLWNMMKYFPQFWLILHQLFDTVSPFPCNCQSN